MHDQPESLESKTTVPELPLERLRQSLSQILHEHRVPRGVSSGQLRVSVVQARARDDLNRLRKSLHQLPPGSARAADWLDLGDGLAAAGLFEEARESLERAAELARAENDPARRAEALFKCFRTACEVGRWEQAFQTYLEAASLAGRYALFHHDLFEPLGILGAGGFGTVFLARDLREADHRVAIKTLDESDLGRSVSDVFGEARRLKALRHPNIIQIEHWDWADRTLRSRPYLALEYFPGHSLATEVARNGPLAVGDWLVIARQVAVALHAAHVERVYHRDVKPENLLVRREGAGWDVRVIDFGLSVRDEAVASARVSAASGLKSLRDRSFAGTWDYAAPEQKGRLLDRAGQPVEVGPYSDVYAFGRTFAEVLFRTLHPVAAHYRRLPEESRELVRELIEGCAVEELDLRFHDFEPVLRLLNAPSTPSRAPALAVPVVHRVPGEILTLAIPVSKRKPCPGEVLTVTIPTVSGQVAVSHTTAPQPGAVLTLRIPEAKPARKPGEVLTLRWQEVPPVPGPIR
jgi:serine/threonine protein kinase